MFQDVWVFTVQLSVYGEFTPTLRKGQRKDNFSGELYISFSMGLAGMENCDSPEKKNQGAITETFQIWCGEYSFLIHDVITSKPAKVGFS